MVNFGLGQFDAVGSLECWFNDGNFLSGDAFGKYLRCLNYRRNYGLGTEHLT